jgi:ABC-type glycerol-3-phosphate transport system substrate-binding protein
MKEFKYVAIARKIFNDFCVKLEAGDKLPTTLEVCKIYNTSEITVKKAFAMLSEQGIVKRVPRRGTVLCEKCSEGFFASGRETVINVQCIDSAHWRLGPALENIAAKYRVSNPSVRFNFIYEMESNFKKRFLKSSPDLVFSNMIIAREFMTDHKVEPRLESLEDLGGFMLDENIFLDGILKYCRNANGTKFLPLLFSTVMKYVNPNYPDLDVSLFERQMSFTEFRELLMNCRPGSNSEFPYPFYLFYSRNRWPVVAKAFGGEIFSPDGRECLLNTEPVKDALKYLIDIIFRDRLCFPTAIVEDPMFVQSAYNLFKYDSFLCTWGTYSMSQEEYSSRITISHLPYGKKRFTPLLLNVAMINRLGSNKEAVRDFLNYLQLFENQIYLSEQSDGFSCQKGIANMIVKSKNSRFHGFERFIESLEYAEPMFMTPRFAVVERLMHELYPVWLGMVPVEKACPRIASEINKMLSDGFDYL